MEKVRKEKILRQFLEEDLKKLEDVINNNQNEIYREVDHCLATERYAKHQGIKIEDYSERRSQLVERYWNMQRRLNSA